MGNITIHWLRARGVHHTIGRNTVETISQHWMHCNAVKTQSQSPMFRFVSKQGRHLRASPIFSPSYLAAISVFFRLWIHSQLVAVESSFSDQHFFCSASKGPRSDLKEALRLNRPSLSIFGATTMVFLCKQCLHESHDILGLNTSSAYINRPTLSLGLFSQLACFQTMCSYCGWLRNPAPVGNYW